MSDKWIGFDMDECIGSVMNLYTFIHELPVAYKAAGGKDSTQMYNAIKNGLYLSERMKDTWVLRPAMYDALAKLYDAHKSGLFYGAFVFSNNSSQELVNFVAYYCNAYIWRRFADYTYPVIFKMGVCRQSPSRSTTDKTVLEIQRALSAHGLPLLTNARDLLFFDDQEHVLAGEISHYVRVRPYYNYCPVSRIADALKDCAKLVGAEAWERLLKKAAAEERIEPHYVTIPPNVKEYYLDRQMFLNAFRSFLGISPVSVGGKRRHTVHRHRKLTRQTRKNSRV